MLSQRQPSPYNLWVMQKTAILDGGTVTCRNLHPADYPDAKQIIAEAFGQTVQANPQVLEVLEHEPWYGPDHLLVAEVDGRVVSFMGVRDGLLSSSGIGVPAGLVGTVCTALPLRGHGIGAELMRHSFDHMQRHRLALSYLHTSSERSGFYSRLGYRRAIIANPRLSLHLGQFDNDETPHSDVAGRTGTPADAESLHMIYTAQYCEQVNGSWSRTVPFWRCRLLGQPKLFGPPPMAFLVAVSDRPVAYIATLGATSNAGTVAEWACLPGSEDIAFGLLCSTLRAWRETGMETAQLTLASCHPLRHAIDRLSPHDETGHSEIWVRVQDRELYLETISPLLEDRATTADLRVEISFRDGSTLALGRGELLQLDLDVSDLCSLIYNGRRLPGLLEDGGIAIQAGDCAALPVLFPDTGAARCAQDAY